MPKYFRFVVITAFLAGCATPPSSEQTHANAAARATAFDHVAIYVSDLSASVAFYQGVFGFEEIPAPLPIARWLIMSNGIALHIAKGRMQPLDQPRWIHFAVACSSMDEMIAALGAKHIAWSDIQGRPVVQVRSDSIKQIFVQDPDGYWIEINDALKSR
jgi:lactoylglutathione lyase